MANINHLSDKELFWILNTLSMSELMRTQVVCQRWNLIHQIVCRSKTDLFLYVPTFRFDLKHYPEILHWSNRMFASSFTDFGLCVDGKELTTPICTFLAEKFPNVKRLHLYGVQTTLKDLGFLLQQWPELEELALVFGSELRINWNLEDWGLFWEMLQFMPSLKNLALSCKCEKLDLLYSNIMSRLESLHINIGYDLEGKKITELFENIKPKLRRLTMTDVYQDVYLQQMELDGVNFFNLEHKFKSILEKQPHIFRQLTFLGWHFRPNSGVDQQLIRFICNKFISLSHLDLQIDCYMSLGTMVPFLAQLKHLTSLRISPQQKINIDFEDEDSQYEQSGPEDESAQEVLLPVANQLRSVDFFANLNIENLSQKLYTVRRLHLVNFDFSLWTFFDYLRVFPNIEILHFESCEFPLKRTQPELSKRETMLQIFRQFQALKRVYRNNVLLLNLCWLKSEPNETVRKSISIGAMRELFKKRAKVRMFSEIYDPNDIFDDLYENGEDNDQLLAEGNDDDFLEMDLEADPPNAPNDEELERFDYNYDFVYDMHIHGDE